MTQTSVRHQPTSQATSIENNEKSSKCKKVKFSETETKDISNSDTPDEINSMLINLNSLSEEILNFK